MSYATLFIIAYPIGVPLSLLAILHYWRDGIDHLQQALREYDQDTSQRRSFSTAGELAEQLSKAGRRPSVVVSVREKLAWIVDKIDKFRPGRYHAGVLLLVLRMLQTSVLVLIPTQDLQVIDRIRV